ncbi:hypothetical protein D0812_06815 [Vibrio owensii]|uniref:Uncharacterized protein n=1 Tax=Vibrio owensii TaxID=696485 RepID=A0AAP9GB39_9VIBR|nr:MULTISPECIES: hypothetical protein [Vibrio]AYO14142.1 hypothetical protein D0812_06815 [Vibrio owensii]KIF50299.1 hypothetical protein M445_00230 [Vibrio owensii 47666-1]MDK9784860.1 hypothetical protein [Vibrio sp. B172a]QGH46799.1 hypothetical protein APZ19_06615 [Vibrio owensii]CAD7805826.1 hypothetical protein ACOMICROBIO_NCLOACGD_01482 [Vibrio sp. B1ASS3]
MKRVLSLALCLAAFGASASQNSEPKSVTLNYDQTQLVAEIQPDNHFEARIDNEQERIDFSGSVDKLHPDYTLEVSVKQASKLQRSTAQVNTKVLIKQGERQSPLTIGSVNGKNVSVSLN